MNTLDMNAYKMKFDKFVIRNESGCWGWKGCAPKNPGYGQFRFKDKLYRCHRASWLIHNGEIPLNKFVCHKCDNKLCSNPDHLFIGTCHENNIDMLTKNRTPILGKKGQLNPNSKLSYEQVIEIRKLLKQKITQTKIAKQFNVSQTAISVINTERYWR